jgi:hypothetical protein
MSAVNRLSKKVVYMGGKVPDHVNILVHSFLARPESTKRIFQIVSLILYGKADSLYPLGTLDLGGNVHEMIVRTPESPDGVYVAQLGAGVFRVLMLVSVLVHSLLERFKDSPEFCDKTYTGAKGVVLIDEIDTHLSIHAQRRVLQELVHFFPQVQFVVSTNSLAVASSLQDKEQFLVYRTCYREDGLGWGLSECAPGENYSPVGSDLNSVADYLFKAPVRDTLYQDKLDLLCTMVANKQLEEAKGLIEWLKERIHPTDSELRRLEARYEAKMCIARAKAEKKES